MIFTFWYWAGFWDHYQWRFCCDLSTFSLIIWGASCMRVELPSPCQAAYKRDLLIYFLMDQVQALSFALIWFSSQPEDVTKSWVEPEHPCPAMIALRVQSLVQLEKFLFEFYYFIKARYPSLKLGNFSLKLFSCFNFWLLIRLWVTWRLLGLSGSLSTSFGIGLPEVDASHW